MSFKNWGNKEASLEALYLLDNALTEPDEEHLRLISKKEDENSLRYVVDNGQGDLLDVIFTREAVLVRGFDHENELNSLSAGKSVIEQIYSGEAAKFRSYFLPDEIEQTTFFIWYDGVEHQNLVGGNNGGRWLLGYAFDEFDKFSEFVKGCYEIEFDDEMLKKLYEKGELEKEKLKEIR
ncbi:sensor histidine kinase [Campylobacter concisus]|uniref:sensor histidine kinase n=1 Tax=Campylobacter concisus TaxID=199 RepID=UPI00122C72CA|nr:sensor histidine kinase [Campylobacter concisus]